VDVASRGLHENRFFFEAMQRDALLGTEVRPDFSFTKDGKHYKSMEVEDLSVLTAIQQTMEIRNSIPSIISKHWQAICQVKVSLQCDI